MNFLGHAFLSFGDAEILTGNMIGDFVKGKAAVEIFPERIQKGIMLHRKIESFTDGHPASQRAKVWFRQTYGLYAGAIVDTLFDHFLATDPRYFKNEKELYDFSQDVYRKLEANSAHFPTRFGIMFPYMQEQNWLYNYRTMRGVQRSLQGLHRRAQHMADTDDAYKTFVMSYYQLAQAYFEFIEKAYSFVKDELTL